MLTLGALPGPGAADAADLLSHLPVSVCQSDLTSHVSAGVLHIGCMLG